MSSSTPLHHVVRTLLLAILAAFITGAAAPGASFEQKLTAPGGLAQDLMGSSVAISGDTAVVGAPFDNTGVGFNAGSVYVYVRSGTTWTLQTQLFASDPAEQDEFGTSVAIEGDTIVVGAPGDDFSSFSAAGSAYVFTRSGATWSFQQKLIALDPGTDDTFGAGGVGISGNTVIVGAFRDDTTEGGTNGGSAYVFVRSGITWSQQARIAPSDAAGKEFATSVAISGDTAVMGTPNDLRSGQAFSGSAYVFTRSGSTWSQQVKLFETTAASGARFGASVAVESNTLVVGVPGAAVSSAGAAGAAYVFLRSGASWSQQGYLTATGVDAAAGDSLGNAVAVSGDVAVIGTAQDDQLGLDAGAAYLFQRSGGTWTQQAKLLAPDGVTSDLCGNAVAINGDTVVVGAFHDAIGSETNAGSAYVHRTGFGGGGSPEIVVEQPATTNIANGGSKAFGNVNVGSSTSLIFTIKNTGNADLTGLTITREGTHKDDYSVTANPVAPVSGPSGSTTFTVQFSPSGAGTRMAEIRIASNDADENPFVVNLSGTGVSVGTAPEIVVEQPANSNIPEGGGRSFGSVNIGDSTSLIFTIKNTGNANLTGLTITKDGTHKDDFSVTANPVAPVSGPNGSTTFTVEFSPSGAGTRMAAIHIANNDTDESPFDIDLSGTGVSVGTAPEIVVEQPTNTNIPEGGGKSFGSVNVGSSTSLIFTIKNTGTANLTGLTITKDGTHKDDFSVTANPVAPVSGPNGSTSFTVEFSPSAAGTRMAAIHIANNDADENPFDIDLSGTGVSTGTPGPGDLDPSLDTDGKVIAGLFSANEYGTAVAVQKDGKIVVAGYGIVGSNDDFIVARFTSSGGLDPNFGTGGVATAAIGAAYDVAYALAIQDDGKIVVGGHSYINDHEVFSLARFTEGGVLDQDFGTGGTVTTDFGENANIVGIALQDDGRIVAAGLSRVGNLFDFAVVRYLSDGAPDPSFGNNGAVLTPVGAANDQGLGVALQADGKIVVVGFAEIGGNQDVALVRYTDTGGLDPNFGTGGKATAPIGSGDDLGRRVLALPGGQILVGGSTHNGSNNDFFVARFTSTGALDTDFNVTGFVTTPVGSGQDYLSDMTVQSNGRIVAVGFASNGSNDDFAVVRYTSGGALDATFGAGGKVMTPIGGGSDRGYGVALQTDGRIVVSGDTHNGTDYDFALVRYLGDAAPDIVVEQPANNGLIDGRASVDFGTVTTSGNAQKTFTIRNTGAADLTSIAVTRSGTNEGDFSVNTTGMSTTLAAGNSTTFTVTFAPGGLGARKAALRVTSNDVDESPYGIALTGTGANTPPVASTSSATVTTGEMVTVTLPFTTPDADGQTVTVQSIGTSNGAPFTLGSVSGGNVPVTGASNAVGAGTINFTVTDGVGGTANGTVNVTVNDNDVPTFSNVPGNITTNATSSCGIL